MSSINELRLDCDTVQRRENGRYGRRIRAERTLSPYLAANLAEILSSTRIGGRRLSSFDLVPSWGIVRGERPEKSSLLSQQDDMKKLLATTTPSYSHASRGVKRLFS